MIEENDIEINVISVTELIYGTIHMQFSSVGCSPKELVVLNNLLKGHRYLFEQYQDKIECDGSFYLTIRYGEFMDIIQDLACFRSVSSVEFVRSLFTNKLYIDYNKIFTYLFGDDVVMNTLMLYSIAEEDNIFRKFLIVSEDTCKNGMGVIESPDTSIGYKGMNSTIVLIDLYDAFCDGYIDLKYSMHNINDFINNNQCIREKFYMLFTCSNGVRVDCTMVTVSKILRVFGMEPHEITSVVNIPDKYLEVRNFIKLVFGLIARDVLSELDTEFNNIGRRSPKYILSQKHLGIDSTSSSDDIDEVDKPKYLSEDGSKLTDNIVDKTSPSSKATMEQTNTIEKETNDGDGRCLLGD